MKQLKKYNYIDSNGKSEREKQTYYLTADGKKFVKRLYSKFEDLFDIAIKQKLITCAHCNCEIYKGSYKKRFNGKNLTFCCVNCAGSYHAMKK